MKTLCVITTTIMFLVFMFSCGPEKKKAPNHNLFRKDNLVAWCVVPFDSMKRTPAERARMLKELGFTQFAYDWREEHLPTFAAEIQALKENKINLKSVWLWIDTDSGEIFDGDNRQLLSIVRDNKVKTDFWLGLGTKHFEGLTDEQKLQKAVASVSYIRDEVKKLGCTISLYNHGDWFGDPINQVRIIERIGDDKIGIVYNFHHAHLQIQQFEGQLAKMLPYLNTVNLNGMKVEGPKILTLGQGDAEVTMLTTLRDSGYKGSLGIICHVETEDAKIVLERNINGLKSILQAMEEEEALATY